MIYTKIHLGNVYIKRPRKNNSVSLPYSCDYYPLLICTRSRIVPAAREGRASIVPAFNAFCQILGILLLKIGDFHQISTSLRANFGKMSILPALEL